MRKLIFILTMVLVFLVPTAVQAERYRGDPDNPPMDGDMDISNHLREECWNADGSFMYYEDEGFVSKVGVDVSKWNGDIDWYALKEQGVEFAIIRVGCRGYETGDLVLDERYYEYMEGANEAGLELGVYFYSQAVTEEEAEEEAWFVLENIAGYPITLPVYFDTEEVEEGEARTDEIAAGSFTLNADAFCRTIEENGYRAGVYASNAWIRRNLDLSWLTNYEIWYAMYSDTPGKEYGFDMWQYTKHGDLYGCDTYLDMNVRVEREY